jgi:hypothetical protein
MTSAFSRPARLLAILIAAALGSTILLATALGAPAKTKDPKGSYTLTKDQFRVGNQLKGVQLICDTRKGRWVPGTKVRNGKGGGIVFLPFSAQVRNTRAALRASTSKAATTRLKATLKMLESRQSKGTVRCARYKTEGGGGGTGRRAKLDIARATGLVQEASNGRSLRSVRQSGEGNLTVVLPGGETRSAFSSGSASVSRVVSGPDGKAYIVFNMAVTIDTSAGPVSCRFVESSTVTGTTVCIAENIGDATDIKFDGLKRVYWIDNSILYRWSGAGSQPEALTNSNISVGNYQSLDSGGVIISGSTRSNGQAWTRYLNPSGGLANLFPTAPSTFIRLFPDGNVYLGGWHGGVDPMGIKRFITSTSTLEQKYWVSGNTNGIPRDAYFSADGPLCNPPRQGFCGWYGTQVSGWAEVEGRIFAIAGCCGSAELWSYFPSVAPATSSVAAVARIAPVGSKIAVAGTTSGGSQRLVIYDPATDTETIVTMPETEVYNLSYSASQGLVLFDGLRFSDNRYVLGTVAPDGTVSIVDANRSAQAAAVVGF